ncbi:hypothetical protein [Microtetraspora malaysiensis]|uniref:Uncharacterized protein n=1 Tax=Microtetraspora malaysiensis TaxID=161358 RepID=A0ABW6SN52_9ACTN
MTTDSTRILTRAGKLHTIIAVEYEGDTTAALLDLATIGDIAVNYLDRTWFASYLNEDHGVQLTDEGRAEIAWRLDGYDEHVCGYTEPNVQKDFAEQICAQAGLLGEDQAASGE